jgi:hypothetical protein
MLNHASINHAQPCSIVCLLVASPAFRSRLGTWAAWEMFTAAVCANRFFTVKTRQLLWVFYGPPGPLSCQRGNRKPCEPIGNALGMSFGGVTAQLAEPSAHCHYLLATLRAAAAGGAAVYRTALLLHVLYSTYCT